MAGILLKDNGSEALGGRGQAAVDRDHRAAGVGRQRRGEERNGGADLLHACRARPRQQRGRIKLLVALDAGGRLEPLGRDGAGVHRDHANIVPVLALPSVWLMTMMAALPAAMQIAAELLTIAPMPATLMIVPPPRPAISG